MHDLAKLPHHLDAKNRLCRAIIETPKGHRSKYDYDRKTGLFRLKTILPDGMSFPLDFGFVPSTLCDDGDPLDVMVLVEGETAVGAMLDVRLIGVIEAQEVENALTERNDRVLAVAATSHLYADIEKPSDLPGAFIDNLAQFWANKDRLEGKSFTVLGVQDGEVAVTLVRRASKTFKKAA